MLGNLRIRQTKHFHQSGRTDLPSGHAIQKGRFVKECIDNKNKFDAFDIIIAFPEGSNIREDLIPSNYKKGNFFKGEFVDKNSGAIFGKHSSCIALNMKYSFRLFMQSYKLLEKLDTTTIILKNKKTFKIN